MSIPHQTLPLRKLDPSEPHVFETPQKRINDGDQDLPFFLTSTAYADITYLLFALDVAMFPQKPDGVHPEARGFPIDGTYAFCEQVQSLAAMLKVMDDLIDEVPPDPGPRRFGNISFRRWVERVEAQADDLLKTALPELLTRFPPHGSVTVIDELRPYLIGSLGSSQRLDYGTGHELSFLAFLACVWKLGGFGLNNHAANDELGTQARGIVIGVIQPYVQLVRRLIKTYNLEPAGSHGVWGLDDHSFLPYIFGSAQLAPPIEPLETGISPDSIPTEGAVAGAPSPSAVTDQSKVEQYRASNMYFSAIGFIYDVKTGPFWEHSPVLYDVSGVPGSWAKINKGMLKMYNAEVLGKFPVVQHFPFGSLLRWEKDAAARTPPPPPTAHARAQAQAAAAGRAHQAASTAHPVGMRAPGARAPVSVRGSTLPAMGPPSAIGGMPGTQAPWAAARPQTDLQPPMRAPWAGSAADRTTGNGDTHSSGPPVPDRR